MMKVVWMEREGIVCVDGAVGSGDGGGLKEIYMGLVSKHCCSDATCVNLKEA
jgi:hypothetical protein